AKLAEEVGFDTIWCDDHFLYDTFPAEAPPHGRFRGVWESFTLLSALAEATSRVTLGPFVACTSFRNPAHLAKIAETLDDVSGAPPPSPFPPPRTQARPTLPRPRLPSPPPPRPVRGGAPAPPPARAGGLGRLPGELLPGPGMRAAAPRPAAKGPADLDRRLEAAHARSRRPLRRCLQR